MAGKNIAMCGLDCNSCAAFTATKNNDDKLRKKTAEEWNRRYKAKGYNRLPLKSEDINCLGCLSETLFSHCHNCEVRICGLAKEIKNCGECEEYRCSKLIELHNRTTGGKETCDKIRVRKSG